jgi:hypothetical protein
MTCYCEAYPFPHRVAGGSCRASGRTTCPECGAVLDEGQVRWHQIASQTRHQPAEYAYRIYPDCPRCGAK